MDNYKQTGITYGDGLYLIKNTNIMIDDKHFNEQVIQTLIAKENDLLAHIKNLKQLCVKLEGECIEINNQKCKNGYHDKMKGFDYNDGHCYNCNKRW